MRRKTFVQTIFLWAFTFLRGIALKFEICKECVRVILPRPQICFPKEACATRGLAPGLQNGRQRTRPRNEDGGNASNRLLLLEARAPATEPTSARTRRRWRPTAAVLYRCRAAAALF